MDTMTEKETIEFVGFEKVDDHHIAVFRKLFVKGNESSRLAFNRQSLENRFRNLIQGGFDATLTENALNNWPEV
jgi:hypothetical protein